MTFANLFTEIVDLVNLQLFKIVEICNTLLVLLKLIHNFLCIVYSDMLTSDVFFLVDVYQLFKWSVRFCSSNFGQLRMFQVLGRWIPYHKRRLINISSFGSFSLLLIWLLVSINYSFDAYWLWFLDEFRLRLNLLVICISFAVKHILHFYQSLFSIVVKARRCNILFLFLSMDYSNDWLLLHVFFTCITKLFMVTLLFYFLAKHLKLIKILCILSIGGCCVHSHIQIAIHFFKVILKCRMS